MGNISTLIIPFLYLCLWVVTSFLIITMISWVFKRLGFHKRDWILDMVFGVVVLVLSMASFLYLGISKVSIKNLRLNVIIILGFLIGIFAICFVLVVFKKGEKRVVFITPAFKDISEKDMEKITKRVDKLRKDKYRVYFYPAGSWIKKDCHYEVPTHIADRIFSADKICIWYAKNCDEIGITMGIHSTREKLFGHQGVEVINSYDKEILLHGGILGKIMFGLEWTH